MTEDKLAALHSSSTCEWYTPPEIIERVHAVLEHIDLDPASCYEANKTVKARRFFDKDTDGLNLIWRGNVFLNPPYGRAITEKWTRKLHSEIRAEHVQHAILLCNVSTSARWWRSIWRNATAICFVDHRIRFLQPGGEQGGSPTHDNAIALYSKRQLTIEKFENGLLSLGPIATKWKYR